MEKRKKDRRLPIVAILAGIVLIAGIAAATIPSLKNYQEETRKQALEAEGRAVYYTAENVVRDAQKSRSDDVAVVMTPDGKDAMSEALKKNLRDMVQADYQIQVAKGAIDGFYLTDGKYDVTFTPKSGISLELKRGSTADGMK